MNRLNVTFEVFGRARNHGKKFPKSSQDSFSGISLMIEPVLYKEI